MAALVSRGRDLISCGYIGPGPRCFLACINADDNKIFDPNSEEFEGNVKDRIYTYVVNIIHTPIQYAGLTDQDKQYDVYYGFGKLICCFVGSQESVDTRLNDFSTCTALCKY